MKTTLLACVFLGVVAGSSFAQRQEEAKVTNDRSSALTPTSPRPVTMANPVKASWLAEPHGK